MPVETAVPTTPLCPSCKGPMVLRTAGRGQFFGCKSFPRCRGTRPAIGNQAIGQKTTKVFEPISILPGSEEQEAIWEYLLNGNGHAVLDCGPGTGKTWTAIQYCLRASKSTRILFVAFNKHIAIEAQGKLSASGCHNVKASTYHSLGRSILVSEFPSLRTAEPDDNKMRKIFEAQNPMPLYDKAIWRRNLNFAEKLATAVKNHLIDYNAPSFSDEMISLAGHYGWDVSLMHSALPLVPPALDECKKLAPVSFDFDDMIWLPVVLDLDPKDRYDVMISDEAQDLNAVQHALMFKMVGKSMIGGRNCRAVVVGDKRQCQPGYTKITLEGGQTTTLDKIKRGDALVGFNRREHRFAGRHSQGPKVSAIQKRMYTGNLFKISTGQRSTECTPNHKWLVRFSERSTNQYITYLMKRGNSFRVGWCQMFEKGGNFHLAQRARIERAEGAWILSIHSNKRTASFEEVRISLKYQIPQVMFREAANNLLYDQKSLNSFWQETGDLTGNAQRCLQAHNRELDYPIWTNSYERRGRTTIFETQACNLLSDIMSVPVLSDKDALPIWTPLHISVRPWKGFVFSLNVEKTHSYVADGIGTLNSIYGFRGALTSSIETLTEKLLASPIGAKEFPLTITRRCPRLHVQLAQMLYPNIRALDDAPLGEILNSSVTDAIDAMKPGDLVICRVNAPMISTAYALIRRNVRPVVKGHDFGKGLLAFVDQLEKMMDVCPGLTPIEKLRNALGVYKNQKVSELSKLGDKGKMALEALRDRCDCMSEFIQNSKTILEIRTRIETLFSQDETNAVVLGTIHRTKGLEAERVFILTPSLIPHPMASQEWEVEQERHAAWIAVTRSKFTIGKESGIIVFCGSIPPIFGGKIIGSEAA